MRGHVQVASSWQQRDLICADDACCGVDHESKRAEELYRRVEEMERSHEEEVARSSCATAHELCQVRSLKREVRRGADELEIAQNSPNPPLRRELRQMAEELEMAQSHDRLAWRKVGELEHEVPVAGCGGGLMSICWAVGGSAYRPETAQGFSRIVYEGRIALLSRRSCSGLRRVCRRR